MSQFEGPIPTKRLIYTCAEAEISHCGTYRYILRRAWAPGPRVLWICLNPSTADGAQDDPTVRKCVGFSRRWGMGAISIVNLFALRATYPQSLLAAVRTNRDQAIGPENDDCIVREAKGADRVIFAWGANADHALLAVRAQELPYLLERRAQVFNPWRLGNRTAGGQPRHPLMAAYNTPLFAARQA